MLRKTLVSGSSWQTPSHAIVAALAKISSKPSKSKYKKKRIGCRAAKRQEELDNVGTVLEGDECTVFRALAARALYLSLDRPGIMFAAKELCREFASPTKTSVQNNKRTL